ncbi:hypothetical protein, partial [Escherichia coli]|uniref:hypothetical protein n=1 Tax=Escherichia coli TaxID=562 RepID=UPI0030046473
MILYQELVRTFPKMNSLIAQYPLVKDLVALKETTWFNPGTTSLAEGLPYVGLT